MKRISGTSTTAAIIILVAVVALAQQYRTSGVTVSGYEIVDDDLYVFCEIWEGCEAGQFELLISHHDGDGRVRTRTAWGAWHNHASSVTVRVRLPRSYVVGISVVGVHPAC